MALTKSAARTLTRQRLKDTVSEFEYSTTLMDTYIASALRDVAVAVSAVAPDYYLKSKTYAAFTDATDPGPGEGEQSHEMYRLPSDFTAFRWAEKISNGVVQYRFSEVGTRDQEGNRNSGSGLFANRVGVYNKSLGTTAYYTQNPAVGRESIAILGTTFRVVPPPVAAGATWKFWYEATPPVPTGEAEPLEIPDAFHEGFCRAWAMAILADGGDPAMAAVHEKARDREIAKAQAEFKKRAGRGLSLGKVW